MSHECKVAVNACLVALFSTIVFLIFLTVCFCPPKVITVVSEMPTPMPRYTQTIPNIVIDPRSLTKPAQDPEIHDPKLEAEYYADQISQAYSNIDASLIKAIVQTESGYNPNAVNGIHVGLMQLSKRWQASRASVLGLTDWFDPYSNILVGTDYMSELLDQTDGDVAWALMIYNGGYDYARNLHDRGIVSSYAKLVLARQQEYEEVYDAA